MHLQTFLSHLDARVVKVSYLTPKIIEIIVYAPAACRHFKPGQFFRLQTYQGSLASPMKPLALTGAYVEGDLLSLIVLKVGFSSSLCAKLQVEEPVSLMGPIGSPTEIPSQENVLLIGEDLGNTAFFSIGRAMREKGCSVRYFAGYHDPQDCFKQGKIEQAADEIIWCFKNKPGFVLHRAEDRIFEGNLVKALLAYQETFLNIDRLLVSGSVSLMASVAHLCQDIKFRFKKNCIMLTSVNAPMQCMMKEICAQCLQRHIDPVTGEANYIYSCVQQSQCLQTLDFDFLQKRLS